LTGFLKDQWLYRRPGRLLVMKDGSLLVSADYAGAVYASATGARTHATR